MATNASNLNSDPNQPNHAPDAQMAAQLIRDKVARIYEEEPSAAEEIKEVQQTPHHSRHQQFMYDLSTSGKDLAAVQTEWHNYYQSLPPDAKHEVWQEFYSSQAQMTGQPKPEVGVIANPQVISKQKSPAASSSKAKQTASKPRKLRDARSKEEVQAAIKHKVSAGGKLQTKHHIQSLLFGLGMGAVVVIIFLFGFFNELVIAPFIQPSRTAASTPLIVNSTSIAAKTTPEVIIPKINVEIPTVFNQKSIKEEDIQVGLESGVVHYPTTPVPGQNGNTAFFGHSSNNIFNKGKYKFAFVLLHSIEKGDTFYLTYNSKLYAYKVFDIKVVEPSQVGVLDPIPGKSATATLITCDPPGTSLRRLVVVGEQISPDPATNAEGVTPTTSGAQETLPSSAEATGALPGNGPTLFNRFINSVPGKIVALGVLVGGVFVATKWLRRPKRSRN